MPSFVQMKFYRTRVEFKAGKRHHSKTWYQKVKRAIDAQTSFYKATADNGDTTYILQLLFSFDMEKQKPVEFLNFQIPKRGET